MRNIFILALALFIFSSFTIKRNITPPGVGHETSVIDSVRKPILTVDKIASMNTNEVEKLLGRKLTLKEKISFKISQYKIKNGLKAKEKGNPAKGKTAFILSLLSLCFLFVPYLVIASIPLAIIGIIKGSQARKENYNDRKAKTAIILGTTTLILIVLTALVIALLFAAFTIES